MFAALRAVHSTRLSEEQGQRSHNQDEHRHLDDALGPDAMLTARQLIRARRAALPSMQRHASSSSDVLSTRCNHSALLWPATVRHVASLLTDPSADVDVNVSVSRLCAWSHLAVSAVLAARLDVAAQQQQQQQDPSTTHSSLAGRLRVRQALLTALRTTPCAWHVLGSERDTPALSIAFTYPLLSTVLSEAQRCMRVVTDAEEKKKSSSVLPCAKPALVGCSGEGVHPSAARRTAAKRSRSAGDDRDGGEGARRQAVPRTTAMTPAPPPAVKKPFSFRIRVGEGTAAAAPTTASTSPAPRDDTRAVVAVEKEEEEETEKQSRHGAQEPPADASRRLLQTRLTAFTHGGGGGASSSPAFAAAAAVLRDVRENSAQFIPSPTALAHASSGCASSEPQSASSPYLNWGSHTATSASFASTPHAPQPAPAVVAAANPYQAYSSRKAPPYTAGVGNDVAAVSGASGPSANTATTTTAPNGGGGGSGGGGGFVTAVEQLASDIRSGRANPASAALLSHRSPALGLRRTGFQAPFHVQTPQQQQQQQQQPSEPPSAGAEGSLSVTKVIKSVAAPKQANSGGGDDEEEAGSYPASLLLPDGSVPAILQPLDPKLVTQVAMEIMDRAGAKQVGWDDIAGLEHAKGSVEEAIVWPLRRPDLFVGLRDPPRGLLLFGPPGTGKTMIARAIANRTACTFLNISSSSLMSKWVGDGEKLVRCLFAVATVKQPSVIFIDEIDSLLSMRGEGEMDAVRRVKTEFLVQLDGVATDRGDRVLLIGATNRPDELDEAARRRMEKRLYIPLPDRAARRQLIHRLLTTLEEGVKAEVAGAKATSSSPDVDPCEKGSLSEENKALSRTAAASSSQEPSLVLPFRKVHALLDADLDHLAEATEGYSGADLKQLCREASMGPLREMSMHQLSEVAVCDLRPIDRRDFRHALRRLKPSVGANEVVRYEEWNAQYGSFSNKSDDDEEATDSDASPTN